MAPPKAKGRTGILTVPTSRVNKKRQAKGQASTQHTNRTRVHRRDSVTTIQNSAPTALLQIFVFGEGSAGELGLGAGKGAMDVGLPRLNHNLDIGVVEVSTGGMHAIALTRNSAVLTWGVNDLGALGRDTTWEGGTRDIDHEEMSSDGSEPDLNPYESVPTAIHPKKFQNALIVQVTAGDSSSFALTNDGYVYGWGTFRTAEGESRFSRKSDGTIIQCQREPMLIAVTNIVQISAGADYCLALDKDGEVYSWGGCGEQHQLGRRLVGRQRDPLIPHEIGLRKKKIRSIFAASNHAFAIDQDGNTWAWGMNNFGQTGIKTGAGKGGASIVPPQKVESLGAMKMLAGGSHHSIGVTKDGRCLVWGRVDGHQMGIPNLPLNDPTTVITERGRPRILLTPTALPLPPCTYVAAGSEHNVALTLNGAYVWGFNGNSQCGQGHDALGDLNIDDVCVPTRLDVGRLPGRSLVWAGAGGQYSMIGAATATKNGMKSGGVYPIIGTAIAPVNGVKA